MDFGAFILSDGNPGDLSSGYIHGHLEKRYDWRNESRLNIINLCGFWKSRS